MTSSVRVRAIHRSRATQRLRNLTIGTAAVGLVATAGFGWLAAMTYDGAGPRTASLGTDPKTAADPNAAVGTDPNTTVQGDPAPLFGTGAQPGGLFSSGVSSSLRHGHVSTGSS